MNIKNIVGLVIRIFGFGVFVSSIKELIYHIGLNGGLCHHFRGIEFSFALLRYFLDPLLGILVVLFGGTLLNLIWMENSGINSKRIFRIVIKSAGLLMLTAGLINKNFWIWLSDLVWQGHILLNALEPVASVFTGLATLLMAKTVAEISYRNKTPQTSLGNQALVNMSSNISKTDSPNRKQPHAMLGIAIILLTVIFAGLYTRQQVVRCNQCGQIETFTIRQFFGIEFNYGISDHVHVYVINTTENCKHQWDVASIRRAYGPFVLLIHEN